jgi:two-component system CheB/CheR fusion protein
LAVVKGLVEMHGGTVEADSAGIGHGAKFWIRLPRVAAPAAGDASPAGAGETQRPLRVLVIEDNRDAADMLRRLLQHNGYEATVAYSGDQGIEEAQKTRPQVVLCDIGLPQMDGYAVASALRSNPVTAECILVAITGYGQDEDRKRALNAGFHHHLTKPVDPRGLVTLLRSMCAEAPVPASSAS